MPLKLAHAPASVFTILALTAIAALLPEASAMDARPPPGRWIRAWGAAMQAPDGLAYYPDGAKTLRNQTLRQVIRVSMGGSEFRIWVSNEFGDKPLTLGAAHVALSDSGPTTRGETDRVLTFSGSKEVVIAPGTSIVSDIVSLTVPDLGRVAVSLYLSGSTMNFPVTVHEEGRATSYISAPGDHAAEAAMMVSDTAQTEFFLSAVDVRADAGSSTLVTLGDSITDGYASTPDKFRRWPDFLAERLASHRPHRTAIANMGISGNRILHTWYGPSALARFDRDVLAVPNVRYLAILEGINDIGAPGLLLRPSEEVTSEEILAGLQQIIARAHEHGIKVFLGTLMPSEGSNDENPGYDTVAGERKRQAINQVLRQGGMADGVIDFDKGMRDPDRPGRLLPKFDSGDHLHPNDDGYRAMADMFDMRLLEH